MRRQMGKEIQPLKKSCDENQSIETTNYYYMERFYTLYYATKSSSKLVKQNILE